jgi:hypothetical protein
MDITKLRSLINKVALFGEAIGESFLGSGKSSYTKRLEAQLEEAKNALVEYVMAFCGNDR